LLLTGERVITLGAAVD